MFSLYVSNFESQIYLQKNLPQLARQDESFSTIENCLSSISQKNIFRRYRILEMSVTCSGNICGIVSIDNLNHSDVWSDLTYSCDRRQFRARDFFSIGCK